MRKLILAGTLAVAANLLLDLAPATAQQAGADPFYQGQTITLVAATAPGGGTDSFARLLAQFLPRFLPGNPTVIVQNMAGGNSVVGANYVYTKAKPDGLTALVASGTNLLSAQRLGQQGVLFDLGHMHVVIGDGTADVCIVSPDTGIREPKDIVAPKVDLVRGALGRINDTSLTADIAMSEILKVSRYRPIYGYDGAGPARLAFMRGETNMHCDSTLSYGSSVVQQMLQQGQAIPVFQSGLMGPDGKIVRHPSAADVPTVEELYQQINGSEPSGIAWDAFRDNISARSFSKIMAFPADVPADRLEVYNQALEAMIKDPQWASESERVTGEKLVPPLMNVGNAAEEELAELMTVKPETLDWMVKWSKSN